MPKAFFTSLTLIIMFSLASQANAQGSNVYFDSDFALGFGAAYQDADAKLGASVANLPEITVDLEDLGMDTEDWSWALEGRWRFKPKWMLVGLAYTFSQDGSRSVERDFNFDGKEFKAGASVDTELEVDTYILDVMYSVFRNDKTEILLGGGIHAIDLEASISGRAFVGEAERERATGTSEILAPLPNIRAQMYYAITDRWGFRAALGWLSANYDQYDGSFVYFHPRIGYAFTERWAAVLGYQWVDIDLTREQSNREAEFKVDFEGPTLFFNYRF